MICTLLDPFNPESTSADSIHLDIATEMTPAYGDLSDLHPAMFPTVSTIFQPPLPSRLNPYTFSETSLSFSSLGLVPDPFHTINNIPPLSLDPLPQPLDESSVENTVGEPSGLYSCKGTWIQWLPGSIWDTYAYAQHELSHVTWQLAQIDEDSGKICLKAKTCCKLLESDQERVDGTCNSCSSIITSSAFLKFVNRASEETLPDKMPSAYFNHKQLRNKVISMKKKMKVLTVEVSANLRLMIINVIFE